jgi:hypothetical protein
MRLQDCHRF